MIRLVSSEEATAAPAVASPAPSSESSVGQPAGNEEKRQAAQALIRLYAGLAAANSLNPIPGLDIGIDAGILTALHHSITGLYGLTNDPGRTWTMHALPQSCFLSLLQPITQRFFPSLTRTAIGALMRQLGLECIGRETTKWLPVVGTAISATIGYQIVYRFGEKLIADCESVTGETAKVEPLPQAA